MFSLGLNQVGVPGSDASGTRGAHGGTCTGCWVAWCDVGAEVSTTGPGAHAGRAGGPAWGCVAGDGGAGEDAGVTGMVEGGGCEGATGAAAAAG